MKENWSPTDERMDRRTDGPTDGYTLLLRCVEASQNENLLAVEERVYIFKVCHSLLNRRHAFYVQFNADGKCEHQ